MKRLLSMILAVLVCVPFVACGSGGEPLQTTAPAASTTAAPEVTTEPETTVDPDADDLGEVDLEKLPITFYVRAHERFDDEISVDNLNGEVVNDEIFQRELRVEERLNVTIETVKEGGAHGSTDNMKNLVLANDDSYDIFSASMIKAANGSSTGIFLDLNQLEGIDLSKPYYTQDYIAQTKINGKNYTVTGDISLSLTRYSFCMFFNKKLVEAHKIEDPYALVRSGKWTHDKVQELVTGIYTDLNGNNIVDDEDYFGLGTSNVIIIDAYTSAYDLNYVGRDADGVPYLAVDKEKFSTAIEKLYKLNWETEGVYAYKEIKANNEMTDLCNYFSQDHLVFINNWISGLETEYLRNMESDFGVIPFPKYDESQESYYTFQHDQIGVFAVPKSSKKAEAAAIVLEAMSSDSRKNLVPTFYDDVLKYKYSRDAESNEMIDIIHNNHKIDFGWIFTDALNQLAQTPRNLLKAQNADFISTYTAKEKIFRKSLESLYKKFDNLDG